MKVAFLQYCLFVICALSLVLCYQSAIVNMEWLAWKFYCLSTVIVVSLFFYEFLKIIKEEIEYGKK